MIDDVIGQNVKHYFYNSSVLSGIFYFPNLKLNTIMPRETKRTYRTIRISVKCAALNRAKLDGVYESVFGLLVLIARMREGK